MGGGFGVRGKERGQSLRRSSACDSMCQSVRKTGSRGTPLLPVFLTSWLMYSPDAST